MSQGLSPLAMDGRPSRPPGDRSYAIPAPVAVLVRLVRVCGRRELALRVEAVRARAVLGHHLRDPAQTGERRAAGRGQHARVGDGPSTVASWGLATLVPSHPTLVPSHPAVLSCRVSTGTPGRPPRTPARRDVGTPRSSGGSERAALGQPPFEQRPDLHRLVLFTRHLRHDLSDTISQFDVAQGMSQPVFERRP